MLSPVMNNTRPLSKISLSLSLSLSLFSLSLYLSLSVYPSLSPSLPLCPPLSPPLFLCPSANVPVQAVLSEKPAAPSPTAAFALWNAYASLEAEGETLPSPGVSSNPRCVFHSPIVLTKSFGNRKFPHKFVNLLLNS